MRKSLGEKRKEISAEQIAEIARLYGDFAEGERVKILPNESFGFQRITVERPLRLRWEVTEATLPAIETVDRLDEADRARAPGPRRPARRPCTASRSTDRAEVARRLGPLPKAIEKAVWDALAVRDPEAPVIADRKGRPEPDPDLRDNENVPLPGPVEGYDEDPTERLATPPYRDAVDAYMAAEVLPYVPDAWVDHAKTKLGYEVPLTRHFFTPAAKIDERSLEADLAEYYEGLEFGPGTTRIEVDPRGPARSLETRSGRSGCFAR